ncbi:hypothetical protein ACJ41O_008955 [Fusarium nematophilum]
MRQQEVTIAAVFLTSDENAPRRRLFDKACPSWHRGQKVLFDMASRISCATHPVPVLASVGWRVPSSGECALYATVCSISALDEFCSLLSFARFGSADTLLNVIGRLDLDAYIDDEHVRTCRNPSDQSDRETCYAHAVAAVAHMALLRIVGREGGCLSISEIRARILHEDNFPETDDGWSVMDVLPVVTEWYRPLGFREVDEDGARQAVLHRRPVLARFQLPKEGWDMFSQHFESPETCSTVLTYAEMVPYRDNPPSEAGHAVVLTGCDPVSLTFLNSWGRSWGNTGSFSIENSSVLEANNKGIRLTFYDVYWLERDLTDEEREAYRNKVDEKLHSHSAEYPGIFELETRCPLCFAIAPIAEFSGSIRQAICPRCRQSFHPEPGHLVQALYAQAGLNDLG